VLSSARPVVHYVVLGIDAPPLNDDDGAPSWSSSGRSSQWGSSTSDVAMLIYASLGVEERRAGETDLLDRYLTLLFEHGVCNYSAADFRTDCELALLLILAGTIGWLTTVGRGEVTRRELALRRGH
jgi:hypothetical protein